MKQPMIVTNIRIPQNEWVQVKIAAAEAGMSVNEYFNYSAKAVTVYKQLFGKPEKPEDKYKAMWTVIKKKAKGKPMSWTNEDKTIYSV